MNGFWMGHQMLGDVLGFCAAAHLYAVKIGQPVKIWFDPTRIDACQYFDGVVWVPRDEIPAAIDCGADPTPEEWPSLNGVKRFYRFMDPTMQPSRSFDVHFSKVRDVVTGPRSEKFIGLITHSNTQGEIDEESLSEMLKEARHLFPNHRIGCLGNMDNGNVPQGVEDWRQARGDVKWIVDYVAKLDLLITPQSGPCFIAAGWRVPMWVYRSRESFWDWTLNYETYQVERWWDRKAADVFAIFDRIYQHGGWNGMGSGPGSAVETNREYIEFLNHLIQRSPTITTILDIGCGDWQIMKHVDLSGKQYLGIDVVASVVEKNNRDFGTHSVGFQVLNPCRTEIPYADLIIMKDVVQHLPGVHVQRILEQIKHRCKFAVIANDYTPVNSLHEISIGEWKPINVLSPPFSLPGCTVGIWNGKHVTLSSFPDGDQSSARQASPVAKGEINSLFELLTPRALPGDLVNPQLIRLGHAMDGGYLVPCDVDTPASSQIHLSLRVPLVSFGVGGDISFEMDWVRRTGMPVVCYDHTATPEQCASLIGGCHSDEKSRFHFVQRPAELHAGCPTQYELLEQHGEFLSRQQSGCLLIVMELHWLNLTAWYLRSIPLLEMLHKNWLLAHAHTNNFGNTWTDSRSNVLPDVVELTWLHRSLLPRGWPDQPSLHDRPLPGLDFPNNGIHALP